MLAFTPHSAHCCPCPGIKADGSQATPAPWPLQTLIFSAVFSAHLLLGPAFLSAVFICSNSHSSVCTLAPIHWTLSILKAERDFASGLLLGPGHLVLSLAQVSAQ